MRESDRRRGTNAVDIGITYGRERMKKTFADLKSLVFNIYMSSESFSGQMKWESSLRRESTAGKLARTSCGGINKSYTFKGKYLLSPTVAVDI